MSKLPLKKLPLIFHFLSEKQMPKSSVSEETMNCIEVSLYQTTKIKNDIFYKPISKIWTLKKNINE